MSTILSTHASPAHVAAERKRARRQAAQGFLSSISLGGSSSGDAAVPVVQANADPATLLMEGAALEEPPLLARADDEPKSDQVVPETLASTSTLSPPPSHGVAAVPSLALSSAPIPISSAATVASTFTVGSLDASGSYLGARSFSDNADRASISGPRGRSSMGRSPYVHLDGVNGLGRVHKSRILLTTAPAADRAGTPFALLSLLGFQAQPQPAPRSAVSRPVIPTSGSGDANIDPRVGVSHETAFRTRVAPDAAEYDPTLLDDPALRIGKHHQIIALPSILGSIIRYSRPRDVKKELNEKFRQAHPSLDPSVTLSKLHAIKERLVEVSEDVDLDAFTLACAFVLFERLVLLNVVTKANRRTIACACLLLASKMGDMRGPTSETVSKIVDALENRFGVSRKSIFDVEFHVMAALDFDLNVPTEAAMPHFLRIVSVLDYSGLAEYLGPASYALYQDSSSH